jgi:dTMP kinase
MTDSTRSGIFLSFEGMDGSGKTTQLGMLVHRLRSEGYDVLETVEPGGTSIGSQIRRILLDPSHRNLSDRAELLLYFASRAQNIDECIRPALAAGRVVVCDRFTDSTLAYQGIARGLGVEIVQELHRFTCRELQPDLTLLLDVDRHIALERARSRNETAAGPAESRIDEEAGEFHDRVRAAYLSLWEADPRRIRRIDAGRPVADVAAEIWSHVETALLAQGLLRSHV